MNIILQHTVNPLIFKVVAALHEVNINCIIWNNQYTSLYDLVIEYEPDTIFCSTDVTPEISAVVNEFRLRTVVVDTINKINNTRLKIRPNVYCLIGGNGYIHNENVVHLNNCADLITFRGGSQKDNYADVIFLSDNPGISLEQILNLSTLCYPNSKVKFKIVGPIGLNLISQVGSPNMEEVLNMLKSSKIAIDSGGWHIYDYVANGIFCISDVKNDITPYYNSGEELVNLINMYLTQSGKRKKLLDKGRKFIMDNRLTCYHTASDLCGALGDHGLQKQLLQCIV